MTKAERIHTKYNQKLSLPCCLRRLGLFGAPLDRQRVTTWWRFLRGLSPRLQMKLMIIPVGRSLVFSGCIVQDILVL